MSVRPDNSAWDLPVSEARDKFAEVVAAAEAARVVRLTRHGRRVAAVVPDAMAEEADAQVRELSKRFAARHRTLLDLLAE